MTHPIPPKADLEAAYREHPSQEALGRALGVSRATIDRWFSKLGIQAREPGGAGVRPERRRGGHEHKSGRPPECISIEMAQQIRDLRAEHPEWTHRQIRDHLNLFCSLDAISLIVRGKRRRGEIESSETNADPVAHEDPHCSHAPESDTRPPAQPIDVMPTDLRFRSTSNSQERREITLTVSVREAGLRHEIAQEYVASLEVTQPILRLSWDLPASNVRTILSVTCVTGRGGAPGPFLEVKS